MLRVSQRIISEKIRKLLEEREENPKLNIFSHGIQISLPEGFSLDKNGYDDQNVSLFYGRKRIAVFNSTKIVAEKIEERIKKFMKNKHKQNS